MADPVQTDTPVQAVSAPQPAATASSAAPPAPPSLLDQYDIGDELPEAVPSPTVTPQLESAPVEAKKPQHSQRVLRMATDLGIPQAEIDRSTPEELDVAVYHLNRQAMAYAFQQGREASVERTMQSPGSQAATPPPVASVPSGGTRTAGTPEGEFDLGLPLPEEEYDAGLIGALKKMGKKITTLEASLSQYAQRDQVREQETVADRLDRHFATHEALLGKGSRRELPLSSPEFQRRRAVLTIVGADSSQDSLESKIDRAVTTLFGASPAAAANTPTPVPAQPPATPERPRGSNGQYLSSEEAERWQRGGVAKPTNRQGAPEPAGKSKAVKTVEAFQRENGLAESPGIEDEFPG